MKSVSEIISKKAFNPITGSRFNIVGGKLISTSDTKYAYIEQGYNINDSIYSAINLILDKVRVAPWNLFKVVDESSLKAYKDIMRKGDVSRKDMTRAMDYHKKGLEPVTNANLSTGKLMELLKWPNEEDTFSDFIANGIGYKLITGDKYILANILESGANAGKPQELVLLPSQAMTVYASDSFPTREIGYKLQYYNLDYSKEQVLHEKMWNPNWSVNGSELYGQSPLRAGRKLITRNNSAVDAASAKFQNGGMEGVLYMDDTRMTPQEAIAQADALKRRYVNEWSGPDNQGKMLISAYKTGFAHLGLSPVELGIIEAEKWDLRKIANMLGGIPTQLLNDPNNRTYNNQKEGEKAFTSRSVLPHLISARESLNRKLNTDWGYKGSNLVIDFDITVFTELQQDMAEVAMLTSQMIGITPNEQREQLGMAARPESEMDEVWVLTQTRTPLGDYQPNAVDEALNNENDNNENDNNNGK